MLNKIIYTILGFGVAFIFFPHPAKDNVQKQIVSGANTEVVGQEIKPAPEMALNLSSPQLTARAALGYDLDSGTILYAKSLDERLPIASLTKLMTAIVVLKQRKLSEVIRVPKITQTAVGSTIGLVKDEEITVESLLKAMLIPSSNDAALALAYADGEDESFVAAMNQEAFELKLDSTHFSNPVGWDLGENYSTSLDLVQIVKEFLKFPVLSEMVRTKQTVISSIDGKFEHQLSTTNKLLLDDPEVVGIKTGFTSKAQGNLIILTNHDNRRILTIVLGSDNRETDTQKLMDWIFRAYRW